MTFLNKSRAYGLLFKFVLGLRLKNQDKALCLKFQYLELMSLHRIYGHFKIVDNPGVLNRYVLRTRKLLSFS